MNVDWKHEGWVRLYRRSTPEWLAVPWQARSLFDELLKLAEYLGPDRGLVKLGPKGLRAIAGAIHWPLDVVTQAVADLLEDGCVQTTERGLLVRNYIPAQDANKSNALKCREYRGSRTATPEVSNATPKVSKPTPRDTARPQEEEKEEEKETLPPTPLSVGQAPTPAAPVPPATPSAGGSALQGGGNDSGAAEAPRRPDGQPSGHRVVPAGERPVNGQPEAEPEDDRPLTKAERIERAHERYAEAYAAGVTSVTGNPLATSKAERADLAALLPVHAKGLRGDALDRWVRETAAAYVQAVRHDDPKYHSGYSPRSFGKWLNGGRPVSRAPFDGKASGTRFRRPEDIKQGEWSMSDAERARVAEQDRARPVTADDLEAFLADLPADEAEAMRKALKVAS